MSYWLSQPAENLFQQSQTSYPEPNILTTDTLIIGSGYGAAMSALVLALNNKTQEKIWVLERGQEYLAGDFPKTIGDLPSYLASIKTEQLKNTKDSLWDVRLGSGISVLAGSGLGGGSLINAGVAIRPLAKVLNHWPAPPQPSLEPTHADAWLSQLSPSFEFVEALLATQSHPRAHSLAKFQALQKMAQQMPGSSCKPAPIAVNFVHQKNIVGVEQPACNDCGNCVSGCNIGAKNHLALNAWPLAKAHGVKIFTGGSVLAMRREQEQWLVSCQLTNQADQKFTLRCRRVIIAAGTLGSTEILLRSRLNYGLSLSTKLGEHFSGNGDALVFGFGQKHAVFGVAHTPSVSGEYSTPNTPIGPTIVGVIQSDKHVLTMEEGAVPYPISQLCGELLSSQALFRRWTEPASAWHIANPKADPLSNSKTLMNHQQTLLCMGLDSSSGTISLADNESVALPNWSRSPVDSQYYYDLHQELNGIHQKNGFDGGYYFAGAQWQFLPDQLSQEMGQNAAGENRTLLTVHPLGGCIMADHANAGVVNHRGQVFSSKTGTQVYDNLYVLDGAILPSAIGVNPLLTISALSHYLTCLMIGVDSPIKIPQVPDSLSKPPIKQGFIIQQPQDNKVSFTFRERMFGSLEGYYAEEIAAAICQHKGFDAPKQKMLYHAMLQPQALVMDVKVDIADMLAWSENPSTRLPAYFDLRINQAAKLETTTVPDEHLSQVLLSAYGTVTLLALDQPKSTLHKNIRAASAGARFILHRTEDVIKPIKNRLLFRKESNAATIGQYVQAAQSMAQWRTLDYQFECQLNQGHQLKLLGSKRLAYHLLGENVWKSLINLPCEWQLHKSNGSLQKARATLRVDMLKMMQDMAPYQVSQSPDTPNTAVAMSSFIALAIRALISTHFWSFAAPDYEDFPTEKEANQARLDPPPAHIAYGPQKNHKARLERPFPNLRSTGEGEARLLRYQPTHQSAIASILLIHGGSHSSRVFWTDTIKTNLAQHLLAQGYEIWLLDHRYSSSLANSQIDVSLDQLARRDIPWAVQSIYQYINQRSKQERKVHIMAHCVGGGSVTLSMLRGYLQNTKGDSMIGGLIVHAVTPWLVASEMNRLRAYALAAFRAYLPKNLIDPIPHSQNKTLHRFVDRIAKSYESDCWELLLHRLMGNSFAQVVCDRMTLFFAQQWRHKNLNYTTHQNMYKLVGPSGPALYKHMYYCTIRELLTDRHGKQTYVTAENIKRYWTFPTLFLHGKNNQEFDIESSRLSAFMLANVRAQNSKTPFSLNDYPSQNVWLKEIDHMGHLDMIIGKNGVAPLGQFNRSFSAISGFFDHISSIKRTSNQEFCSDHTPPQHHTAGNLLPRTGPIISRPRIEGDYLVVRILLETSQTAPYYTEKIKFSRANGWIDSIDESGYSSSANMTLLRMNNFDPLRQSQFWLFDYKLALNQALEDIFPISISLDNNSKLNEYNHYRPSKHLLYQIDWRKCTWFQRLWRRQTPKSISFLAGSCLYPGLPFEQDQSDSIYATVLQHCKNDGVDFMLRLGDQIYADATAELLDPKDPAERYRERYRQALGSPYRNLGKRARTAHSHLPSYCVLDDHEISDNWQGKFKNRQTIANYQFARREAWNYQMQHEASSQQKTFWYTFEQAGLAFFALDTRSERCQNQSEIGNDGLPRQNKVINNQQLAALDQWLIQQQGYIATEKPLLLISGSPIAPIANECAQYPSLLTSEDNLLAHPDLLLQIYQLLNKHQVRRLIWLSSDPHFSCVSEVNLQVAGQSRISIQHIIASGLYSPLPFVNERTDRFNWGTATIIKYDNGLSLSTTPQLITSESGHIICVTLSPQDTNWLLELQAFNAKRALLNRCTLLL